MNYSKRIGLLRRRMSALPESSAASSFKSLAGLLVTHLPDVRWLCGFTGSNAALAITRRSVRLFTDGRYKAQAAEEVQNAKVEIVPKGATVAAVEWLAAQVATGSGEILVGVDANNTSVAELAQWKATLPSRLRRKLLVPISSPIAALRMVKDEEEIAIMAEAAALGDRLFEQMLQLMEPGITEAAVAAQLEFSARTQGAEGMSFETIVASGTRSALPHGRATDVKLPRHGFITLDFGVILKGYCSDMTRTVCIGRPSLREREVYDAVLAAQVSAVDAVIAGAECGQVDEAARSILRTVGMEEAFSHSTGHGVGLEIHEGPRIGTEQKEKLAAGMVITVEPGAYFAGEFGVRIEDMLVVERTGRRVLTQSPKALIEL